MTRVESFLALRGESQDAIHMPFGCHSSLYKRVANFEREGTVLNSAIPPQLATGKTVQVRPAVEAQIADAERHEIIAGARQRAEIILHQRS
jgi:hypothetical protein